MSNLILNRAEQPALSEAFVADLVAALGGDDVSTDGLHQSITAVRMRLGDLRLALRLGYGSKARTLTATLSLANRQVSLNAGPVTFPKTNLNAERPLEALVKAIRRLIAEAQPPLDAAYQRAREKATRDEQLQDTAEALRALAFPGLTVAIEGGLGRVVLANDSRLSGTLYPDGTLSLSYASLSSDKARALLRLLTEDAR